MQIKKSAIIYSGYEYQTLQGILVLASWLNNPTAYKRICFEADQDDIAQGIDDIVIERQDSKIDYIQVKFTPSPYKDENSFSWNWLLTKTGKTDRSRSILKKIFDATIHVEPEKRGDITLLTNKIPNREIEDCLRNGKIIYDLIDTDTQTEIQKQLKDEKSARTFFEILNIAHTQKNYPQLLGEVKSELEKHSKNGDIYRLIVRAGEWAKFKNQPTKDGWIDLHHIREILSSKRAKPIPESFSIPENYCLPDKTFHKFILERTIQSSGEIISIKGEPGKGKSTYLSYLFNNLEELEIPVIRHHYFLSIDDITHDRLNFNVIAESLIFQIKSNYEEVDLPSEEPEKLHEVLNTCAKYFIDQSKPFVLIIDGLDHVWRNNQGDKKPLDYFFREILPIPDNLVLIIGTQPVDNTLLPDILLYYSPKRDWFNLPSMTGESIYEYLNNQILSDRLYTNCHEDMIEEEIKSASIKLLEITSGYPLHVIYSCEFIANSANPLSTYIMDKLPPCSDNNIENYYNGLWRSLTYNQRDILHLCAGFSFIWPRNAFIAIFDHTNHDQPSLNAVSHLLFEGKAGLRPFHESLIVFIKKQDNHNDRVLILADIVSTWLNDQAPEYLKQTWLWLSQSINGNNEPLLNGLSRDWIIDRLSEGYNDKLLIQLLSKAETIAFNNLNFSEAYCHRSVKTRLLNGSEFQIWNSPLLRILSFSMSPNSLIDFELTAYPNYNPKELAILSIALWNNSDFSNAKMIANQAISKYKSQRKLYHNRNRDDETLKLIVNAGVLSNELNYENIFKEDNFEKWDESLIKVFIKAALLKNDTSLLVKAFDYLTEYKDADEIELSLIRQSIIEEFDIFSWEEFKDNYSHPSTEFCRLIKEKDFNITTDNFHISDGNFPYELTSSINYYEWFFEAVVIKLEAKGDFSWLNFHAEEKTKGTTFYLNELTKLASTIANNLINKNELNFSLCSDLLETISFPEDNNYKTRSSIILFKRDWLKISADLHLFINYSTIDADLLQEVIVNEIYLLDWIRLWYTDITLNILSDKAANLLLEEDIRSQSNELEETIERANRNLELANIAFRHNNKVSFKIYMKLCWDYVIGYGSHKDTTIFHLLDSIDHLSNKYPNEAQVFLKRISPIVFNISDFTDGDETKHSKSDLTSLLAKTNSSILVSKYYQEINDGEWYYANTSLSELLKVCDFNSIVSKHFCLTGLPEECHEIIINKANEDNQIAIELIDEINNLFNINILEEKKQRVKEQISDKPLVSSLKEEKTTIKISKFKLLQNNLNIQVKNVIKIIKNLININEKKDSIIDTLEIEKLDPSIYPPENIEELDKLIKNEYKSKEFWYLWYSYWVENGKEQELVEILPTFLSENMDKFYYKACLYDNLFHSIKKFKGKKKAFQYIINAHAYASGWEKWYSSEEDSFKRLDIVATIYSNQINEFILQTTQQVNRWRYNTDNLIIPSDRLVYLLIAANKKDEAIDLINAMFTCLENDTINLNLKEPSWKWDDILNEDEIFINMLTSRLKWPIPTSKILILRHLSELLLEMQSITEDALIKLLKEIKQESECVEILSILLMAKDLGYTPEIEFGKYINARSILSDMIIDELKLTKKGKYSTNVTPDIILSDDDKGFQKAQGHHVQLIYKSLLEKEENKTGIPFVDYYQSEWINTFEYAPSQSDNIDYFFGAKRENTAQFYTSTSHRGRSAYLRVLEIAKEFYKMPESYAESLATHALPIEPAYNKLTPSKPNWIVNWIYKDDINKSNLLEYLNKCIVNLEKDEEDMELGAISFPFQIDENNWLDITIVKAVCTDEISTNITIEEKNIAMSYGEKLNRNITYFCHELEEQQDTIQLTGSTYPLSRFGHFYSDLESRGIYIPLTYDKNKDIVARSNDDSLKFETNENIIGKAGYWYYKWEPTHPKEISSLCGTYTLLSKPKLNTWINDKLKNHKHIFICKVNKISRDRTYVDYNQTEEYFIIDPANFNN